MRKFVKNTSLFVLLIIVIFSTLLIGTTKILNSGSYYLIDENTDKIVLGHSHAANAFNDSLIDHFKNLGTSGESFFYTFYKTKKIIEANKQIKTVFIIFTNNQIELRANSWIWSDKYLNHTFPKYAAFIDWEGYKLLMQHNWKSLFASECIALRENLYFISRLRKQRNYIAATEWGEYGTVNKVFISESNATKKNEAIVENKITSSYSISYLMKTINLLKENKINVFLIRSPLHKDYPLTNNEIFLKTLNDYKLENMFLDFKDYPLQTNQFIDSEHLNAAGSREFSLFFNTLLAGSLLQKDDKQVVIKKKIDELILVKKQKL
jgi:hypothetical protein